MDLPRLGLRLLSVVLTLDQKNIFYRNAESGAGIAKI